MGSTSKLMPQNEKSADDTLCGINSNIKVGSGSVFATIIRKMDGVALAFHQVERKIGRIRNNIGLCSPSHGFLPSRVQLLAPDPVFLDLDNFHGPNHLFKSYHMFTEIQLAFPDSTSLKNNACTL